MDDQTKTKDNNKPKKQRFTEPGFFEEEGDDLYEFAEVRSEQEEEECFKVIDYKKYQGDILSTTDDQDIPAFTFRAVFIGVLFGLVLSAANTMLSFRTNHIKLPGAISIILGYPIGVAMSKMLPRGIFNPGQFSMKEHVLLTIIATTASGRQMGIKNVVAQRYYLHQENVTFVTSLAFVLSAQLIGYGLAGFLRRFLVIPKVMIWPANLSQIALFRVFHETPSEVKQSDEQEQKSHGMSRSTFFWFVFVCIFFYELIPTYFATIIQSVSVLCLFSSSNLATMLGSSNPNGGLGVLALSFDWSLMEAGGPLHTPYFAFVNHTISAIVFTWVLPFIFQQTNPFNAPFLKNSNNLKYRDGTHFPAINTVDIFNRTGYSISAASLMNKKTLMINETMYRQNAPIYLTSPTVIMYLGHFALVSAMLCHVVVWYGKTIVHQVKDMWNQRESKGGDIHSEIMKRYWDIPEWVYFSFTAVMLVVQVFVLQYTAFKLEWFATLLAFVISTIFLLPVGFIKALTNQTIGINVLTEMVIGFIMPGQTIQVMTFQSIAAILESTALDLTSHLKLGYYTHVPPVAMVTSQFIGTIIGGVVSTSISFLMMDSALERLMKSSSDWNAIGYKSFVTSGAIWGSIGPGRFFGPNSPYFSLLFGFPVGVGLSLLPWIGNKLYASKHWHLINVPLLLSVTGSAEKDNAVIVTPFIIATIFQWFIYNRHYSWWRKYNFTLSAALDTGTSVAVILAGILTTMHIQAGKGPMNPSQKAAYCFAPMVNTHSSSKSE